jgi:hypothetical protein
MKSVKLPNFLIVGAARAGTTVIWQYLRHHPHIFLPNGLKESFFFSQIPNGQKPTEYSQVVVRDIEKYKLRYRDVGVAAKVVGEVCNSYLYYFEPSIENILEFLGRDIRIIIVLRDPISRAYSNYILHVRDGMESCCFQEALDREDDRIRSSWWWGYHYKKVGLYSRQVEAYLSAFEDRVSVFYYDEFIERPKAFYRRILEDLGVDEVQPIRFIHSNVAGLPRNSFFKQIFGLGRLRLHLRQALPSWLKAWSRFHFEKIGLVKPPPMAMNSRELLREFFASDLRKVSKLLDSYQPSTKQPEWLAGNSLTCT